MRNLKINRKLYSCIRSSFTDLEFNFKELIKIEITNEKNIETKEIISNIRIMAFFFFFFCKFEMPTSMLPMHSTLLLLS